MGRIKLICCDIDGTLVKDDKTLSETNKKAIRRVVNEIGIPFSIVSGRIYSAITPYYDELGFYNFTSCLNGSLLCDKDGKILKSITIKKEVVESILLIAREYNVDVALISEFDWYTEEREGFLYEEKRPIYRKDSIVAPLKSVLENRKINKVLILEKDPSILDRLISHLKREIKEEAIYYGPFFVEIMASGVNKGTAINDISLYTGIAKDEIMALGDDYNDKEMLEEVYYSVAMGNSPDSVKRCARFVTDSNSNDGVAKAIEKLLKYMEFSYKHK